MHIVGRSPRKFTRDFPEKRLAPRQLPFKPLQATVLALLSVFLGQLKAADTTLSKPVGVMTFNVPIGQSRALSLPLLASSVGPGAVQGTITGVGPDYVDVAGANWPLGAYSNPQNPYFLRILTGAAAGRMIPVSSTSNTTTRLMLSNDGLPLDLGGGPAVGDDYELVLADTLGTVFGSGTLQGGVDYSSADLVYIWASTAWLTYYFNTSRNRWERTTDTAASATRNNILLRHDRGFMIARRGNTPLKFFVTGRVPDLAPRYTHSTPGVTFLTHGLPVATSLGEFALQSQLPGWRGSTSGAAALIDGDLVQVWGGASWLYFYYDTGRNSWQNSNDTASSPVRNTFKLQPGQSFMVRRQDVSANQTGRFITTPLSYPH